MLQKTLALYFCLFFVFVMLYFRQIQVKCFLKGLENELNLLKFVPLFIKCKYIQNIALGKVEITRVHQQKG